MFEALDTEIIIPFLYNFLYEDKFIDQNLKIWICKIIVFFDDTHVWCKAMVSSQ